ncbi:hypothetical protein INT45_003148 [Circinella minor]|uniref:Uncharacterized protein n=1 Tax=Circinella minor TaxID=1195481 RepID=A0A8H7RPY1_9FUNG|nr:hypothetical protein INT45_003148 [Circinella minor]
MHWDIISATAKISRSIDASLKDFYRLFPKYFDNKDAFIAFKLMESLLSTVSSHPQMLQKQNKNLILQNTTISQQYVNPLDVRLLIDQDGKEYGLCSGELAKEDDHDKTILDKAKLNRESKCNLDCILDICEEDNCKISTP